MQKEIEKILRKYKVIATTNDYILAKEITDTVINLILENHKIDLKQAEQAEC